MCKTKEYCKHPEKMIGKDPEDCTLKQIKECHPEFYNKILKMWEDEQHR